MLAVEESLSEVALEILGAEWRKVELREFQRKGRRVRVELRNWDHKGRITVVDGPREISCVQRSLKEVLTKISQTV
jgi:hypothetical protein